MNEILGKSTTFLQAVPGSSLETSVRCSVWYLFIIIGLKSNYKSIMKEITLRVPDQKVEFVLELFDQLGIEVTSEELEIPEEHKAIVRERIKTAKEEEMVPWKEARKQFTFKTRE